MKTMRRIWILILGMMLPALAGLAGTLLNPTVLSNGVVVSGYIAPGGEEWFVYDLRRNIQITSIETALGSLPDSVISLYRYNMWQKQLIKLEDFDDDGGVGLASKIERPQVYNMSTLWYVKVAAYSPSQSGTFSICMKDRTDSAVQVIPDGRRYTGYIGSPTENCWFWINSFGGAPFVFETALGSCPDTYMYLYTPDNYPLAASDDDSGEGYASRIETRVPHPYYLEPNYIKVRAYSENQQGTFSFWVKPTLAPVLLGRRYGDPSSGMATTTGIRVWVKATNCFTQYTYSQSPSFPNAVWRSIDVTTNWVLQRTSEACVMCVLSPEEGPKTLYIKVRNACGESGVTSITFNLKFDSPLLSTDGTPYRQNAPTGVMEYYRFYVSQPGRYRITSTAEPPGRMYQFQPPTFYFELCGPHTLDTYIQNFQLLPLEVYLAETGYYYIRMYNVYKPYEVSVSRL